MKVKITISKLIEKYKNLSVIAKSSFWFIITGFFQRGISVITTPIFTRLLSTEEYGRYTVFNSWLEIITIFATLRLGYGVFVKGLVKYSEDKEKFSSSLLGLATTWCGIFFVIYLVFHNYFNNLLGLSTLMMLCMFVMMISTVAFNFWAAQKRNEFEYISLIKLTIFTSLLKPILGILAVISTETYKVEYRILSIALVELFAYIWLYIRIMTKGKVFYHKEYWRYGLKINIPLVPHFLSQVILNHSDRIMIKQLCGYSDAGIYSLAYSIAMILTILNTSIQNAIRPWVFQRLKANEHYKIENVGTISLIIIGVCNLFLIIFAPELIKIFSPSSYGAATYLIPPIAMGVYFAFMYNLFVDIQMYFEKTNSIMNVAIICALVNIITNYIFIKKFGFIAAAYTTLFSYILMAILHYFAMKKILDKQEKKIQIYSIKKILLLSVVFLFIGTIMPFLYNWLVIRIAITIFLLIISFSLKNKILSFFQTLKKEKVGK